MKSLINCFLVNLKKIIFESPDDNRKKPNIHKYRKL